MAMQFTLREKNTPGNSITFDCLGWNPGESRLWSGLQRSQGGTAWFYHSANWASYSLEVMVESAADRDTFESIYFSGDTLELLAPDTTPSYLEVAGTDDELSWEQIGNDVYSTTVTLEEV